ncbi:MAG TPA: helix-turn-helix domain-containing protein [Acidimicrobiales bacterium]
MTAPAQFVAAVERLAAAVGATFVPAGELRPSDVAVDWDGEVVGGIRVDGLQGALRRMITSVERELGGRLADLPREQKQAAVRLLHERGAFLLRKAADDVADTMGVSRITIYNYLNAIESQPPRST